MKSYTDINQSKKLAEILPIESADMTWEQVVNNLEESFTWKPTIGLNSAIKNNSFSYRNGYVLPCWSLAALINALPLFVRIVGGSKEACWYCEYVDSNYNEHTGENADTPIDACYNLILKLHELNLL